MNIESTENQRMFADVAKRVFSAIPFPSTIVEDSKRAQKIPNWVSTMFDAQLLGVCAPERVGGLGLGIADTLPIVIEAGSAVVPFPVSETLAAAKMLAGWQDGLAADLLNGKRSCAIADVLDARLVRRNEWWVLTGTCEPTSWAMESDFLLLPHVSIGDGDTVTVLTSLSALGCKRTRLQSIDLTHSSALVYFDDVLIDPSHLVTGIGDKLTHLMALFVTAEMLGAARTAFRLATEYMMLREQFGHVIGKNQVLKHIAADALVRLESLTLALDFAAWSMDSGSADGGSAVSVAKSYGGDAARKVAEDSIQIHGGIGFTWDLGLHHYLRRILRCAATFGNATDHRSHLSGALERNRGLTFPIIH
ncbi:MAG TPA: acyl-CoA dehydrogenase family protein [Bryobacteraceae bacterium]|jgi:alkylation response protein AidB-like acyl-CoA dehydrogenase|nr:acyl-CoA dehydrogenase family protein [Bryobacteraceae bacterium]